MIDPNVLSNPEKIILSRIEDHPDRKFLGKESTIPNYLMSLKLAEDIGSGRYRLTPEGKELYYFLKLGFDKKSINTKNEKNEKNVKC